MFNIEEVFKNQEKVNKFRDAIVDAVSEYLDIEDYDSIEITTKYNQLESKLEIHSDNGKH